ncbi:hypothetical protein GW756_02855 [bacterium]|nr:hypothetical protein [bacterium]NCQ55543.1 hypothetical protein [Candidatus Parcubacteria bacterium]NCS67554.1 hypothetical protein [Candidatus Peregrinibacteria bacterium]NCS96281.1 hypothetical protein [bacterium]
MEFKWRSLLWLLPMIMGSSFLFNASALAQVNIVCTDSDKGKNLALKGELNLKFYQDRKLVKEQAYEDFFSGSRNRYLEFYCNGNQPAYEIVACPNEELGKNCPVIEALAAEPKIEVKSLSPVFSQIITPRTQELPVLNFSLNAYDGDVILQGLHFVLEAPETNTTASISLRETKTAKLYNYKLYDSDDRLVAQTKSSAGRVYFDFTSSEFMLSGSENFTVKVDLPLVDTIDESWQWFKLSLDKSYEGSGIQAIGAESLNFVEQVVLGQIGAWPSTELFINAATKISLGHARAQPEKVTAALRGQEFYHFTVEADSAGPAEIEQLTLEVLLEGMQFSGEVEGRVFVVDEEGMPDFTKPVVDNVKVEMLDSTKRKAMVRVDFKDQLILAGRTNTYALFLNRTVDTGGPADDSYAFTILSDDRKSTTREARLLKTASNIVWSDLPGISETNRFMRGFLVPIEAAARAFID